MQGVHIKKIDNRTKQEYKNLIINNIKNI